MDRATQHHIICPCCEDRGIISLDDNDTTLPCPLCNSWCTLCLAGAPTPFVMIRVHRGSLVAGMQSTADGIVLFEGYVCDYHKASLRSYSYIAPSMIGHYWPGEPYLAAQGRVFIVLYGCGEAKNWQELEDAARQAISPYKYAPYGFGLYPCPPELAAQAIR
jgi:hypothetical protein